MRLIRPTRLAILLVALGLAVAVPDLFGKPQQYATFLDREISFNKTFSILRGRRPDVEQADWDDADEDDDGAPAENSR